MMTIDNPIRQERTALPKEQWSHTEVRLANSSHHRQLGMYGPRCNGLLWYARPSPIAWLLGSAVLGIVFFSAFLWYLIQDNHPRQERWPLMGWTRRAPAPPSRIAG
jgi:hypothetical protein